MTPAPRGGPTPRDAVPEHLLPLGDTGWSVWRDVVLRSTGFADSGLDRFAAPQCAAAADSLLDATDGAIDGAADELADQAVHLFDKEFGQAVAAGAQTCVEIAADPRFREAVAWQQSTAARSALDGLVRGGPDQPRNGKRRERESVVSRYWQRYCAKNETIGFFGPAAWATIDPDGPAITVSAGRDIVARRQVELEHWALSAYARAVAGDPRVRRWLPPALRPHLTVADRTDPTAGHRVLRPMLAPLPVSAAQARALAACDGRRPAAAIITELVAGGVVRTDDDGYLMLEQLVERGLLTWSGELPLGPRAESHLRELLGGIGERHVRDEALAGLDRLTAARDRVAHATGDPDRLAAALAGLNAEFTALTGVDAQRKAGQAYAGRGLCYEETVRDLDVVLGGPLLDDLAAPLALLLRAARWLTAELAEVYGTALRELYDELATDGAQVRLADLWYIAQGPLFGSGERPVDRVAAEFVRRWATLFGLDQTTAGDTPLHFSAADLGAAAEVAFPATRSGWSSGRLHSPDLQICARDADAIRRGDYLAVLGELHAAWPTFDCAVFTRWHPDPAALRDALAADLGEHRIRPLFPADWPRYTGRVAHTLDHPTDRQLGFADAPGADPDRLLTATAVTVSDDGTGQLVARGPDGTSWPLIEMFSALLAMHAVDGFKLVGATRHAPRITIDKLVVARQTWRTTIAETGLADVTGERARYLAVRAWRRRLGLPERVFVKLAAETKPVYVDLTSPVYAVSLCAMLRGAHRAGRADAVTVTEMLPDVGQNWLADADDNRYFSELRLQLVDPIGCR